MKYTTKQLYQHLNISRASLYNYITRGFIVAPKKPFGSRNVWTEEMVQAIEEKLYGSNNQKKVKQF